MDCGGIVEIPNDCLAGEIVSCPDCGLDYMVVEGDLELHAIKELTLEDESVEKRNRAEAFLTSIECYNMLKSSFSVLSTRWVFVRST